MEIKGIDVSKYQGKIDWNLVKNAGYNFAFIRIGYSNYDGTITDGLDPYYAINMENAIKAGVNVGVYVYSYANTIEAAKTCAQVVLEKIKPYSLTMPVAFDFEDSKLYSKLSISLNTSICDTFLNIIQSAGYYPMLYTYTSFANSYLSMSSLSKYDLWIADYRGYVGYKGNYTIWQYSSSGTVPGISGRVDMNVAYKDYPSLIKPMENLSNLRYRVKIENKCQGFGSKNVDDVVEINGEKYLPIGDYKIVSKENYIGEQGFYWCEIRLPNGNSCYAVYNLPDNRCEIVDITKDMKVDDMSLEILIENKNQAFLSRDTNDVVKFGDKSYIPLGTYELITMDTEPHEEGLYWCQFRYTDRKSFYAVYNLPDNRCKIVYSPKEENTSKEEDTSKNEVPIENDNKQEKVEVKRIEELEKEISSLKSQLEEAKKDLNEFKELFESSEKKNKENLDSALGQIKLVCDWIKSF